ncbi:Na+-driven multidrug efflux pump [Amycolatopsis arida]|uniref:Probable multidrug resistance protein NorM n=1 Tax=Amycolatopsis arida TaxID=587909 RepID=A0A1I5Z282_9PSEU|nr:MATE family efflux transporter [Amycolatopsis arida]TDX90063.1 Na+-driven multidrug efflux pump [Amycolatopsis arida]SFQ50596.1 Na+-driven multidrug efflux pump [Amycolatopsis arida]
MATTESDASGDAATGTARLVPALLRLAWPLALSGMVTVAIAGNDTVLLGRLGADAVAIGAVAVGVHTVAVALLSGFGIPAQVIAARRQGAADPAGAAHGAERTVAIALWVGVPLAGALALGAEPLITAIAGPAVDVPLSAAYLRIVVSGLPALAVGVVLRGFATGISRSAVVLVSTTASAAVDVAASILFLRLGAGPLGVAAGTLLGSVVPAVVFLVWSRRIGRTGVPVPTLRGVLRRPARRHREAWSLGWPEALLGATGTGSIVVVTVLLAPSGAVALATVRALDVAELAVWMLISGLAAAGTTLLGERIGAGDPHGTRRVVLVTAGSVGTVAVTCAALLPLVTPAALRLAVDDARVAAEAERVVWLFWAQVLWMAGTATTNAVLRAHRDTRTPLRASLIGEYVVFLPLGWLLCRVLHLGVTGIYLAHHVFWATFLAVGLLAVRARLRHTPP